MAMCVIAVVGAAPCQCFSPGGNQTTSPGRISSTGPPSRCTRPQPGGDDQRLPERVRVPRRARARLERDARARHARRVWRLEQRVDADRAGEPVRRSFARRLRTDSLDFHGGHPLVWPFARL